MFRLSGIPLSGMTLSVPAVASSDLALQTPTASVPGQAAMHKSRAINAGGKYGTHSQSKNCILPF